MLTNVLKSSTVFFLCKWYDLWNNISSIGDSLKLYPSKNIKSSVAFGFIYKSNSKVAWVDWIISDKNYKNKESRKEGITYLIQALTEICKQLNYKYCYALINHKGLIKTYEDLGYIKADNYNQELIKHL